MNWETRRYAGDEAVLEAARRHLADRRTGHAEPDEAIGIMSHHQFHDEECWQFLDRFAALVDRHPSAVWASPAALMAYPASDAAS